MIPDKMFCTPLRTGMLDPVTMEHQPQWNLHREHRVSILELECGVGKAALMMMQTNMHHLKDGRIILIRVQIDDELDYFTVWALAGEQQLL
jgi:hypothetical protein